MSKTITARQLLDRFQGNMIKAVALIMNGRARLVKMGDDPTTAIFEPLTAWEFNEEVCEPPLMIVINGTLDEKLLRGLADVLEAANKCGLNVEVGHCADGINIKVLDYISFMEKNGKEKGPLALASTFMMLGGIGEMRFEMIEHGFKPVDGGWPTPHEQVLFSQKGPTARAEHFSEELVALVLQRLQTRPLNFHNVEFRFTF